MLYVAMRNTGKPGYKEYSCKNTRSCNDQRNGIDIPYRIFQKFLKNTGVLDDLEKAGIEEGDTVRMYGLEFDYYK